MTSRLCLLALPWSILSLSSLPPPLSQQLVPFCTRTCVGPGDICFSRLFLALARQPPVLPEDIEARLAVVPLGGRRLASCLPPCRSRSRRCQLRGDSLCVLSPGRPSGEDMAPPNIARVAAVTKKTGYRGPVPCCGEKEVCVCVCSVCVCVSV